MSVVGVALPPVADAGRDVAGRRSGAHRGDSGAAGRRRSTEPPEAISATVVGLYPNGENGQTVVSVEVPQEQAAELAARAATGKVALVLDSRER